MWGFSRGDFSQGYGWYHLKTMDVQLQREKKFRRIKKEVEENGNLKAIQMVELRDAYGRDALGKHVVAGISRQLRQAHLGGSPTPLPARQEEWVILYRLATPPGEVMEQVAARLRDSLKRVRELTRAEEILDRVKAARDRRSWR